MRREGLYLAEGFRVVMDILATSPGSVVEVMASESFAAEHQDLSSCKAERVLVVPDRLFSGVSATVHSQGIVAVCSLPSPRLEDVVLTCRPCLVLDRIADPGNVGTMIRTAAAFDCPAVILTRGSCEAYSAKAVRASAGAAAKMMVVQEVTPEMLSEWACAEAVTLVAAVLDGTPFENLVAPERHAIVIGSEAEGLSDEVLASCAMRVKIPISPSVESLNAAVAAGILLGCRHASV